MRGNHYSRRARYSQKSRRVIAAVLVSTAASAGTGVWAAARSAAAAPACILPRQWVYVATGYNRQTGTAFGKLVCRVPYVAPTTTTAAPDTTTAAPDTVPPTTIAP